MKFHDLVFVSPLLLVGCASVAPYQSPAPSEPSAFLSIEFGNETGDVEISYGRIGADDCFEFPVLHGMKGWRSGKEDKRPVKEVKLLASSPQILRYKRLDYNEYCDINLRFLPQQGGTYLLQTSNRYLKPENDLPAFFGGGPKRQCVVELFSRENGDVLKPVQFERLPIKPTRIGLSGCPKILKTARSAFLVGSRQKFDLDTSGTMRHISLVDQ